MRYKEQLLSSLLLVIFFFTHSTAQTNSQPSKNSSGKEVLKKGNFTTGLNFMGGWGSSTNKWSVTGQAGYFFADRWIGGFQLSAGKCTYGPVETTTSTPTYSKFSDFSLTPEIYTRYYFTSYRLKPFAQLSSGYNGQWRNEDYNNGAKYKYRAGNFVLAGAVGASFMLGKQIVIEALYNQQFFKKPKFTDDANRDLKFRIGASFFLVR